MNKYENELEHLEIEISSLKKEIASLYQRKILIIVY